MLYIGLFIQDHNSSILCRIFHLLNYLNLGPALWARAPGPLAPGQIK